MEMRVMEMVEEKEKEMRVMEKEMRVMEKEMRVMEMV